MPEEIKLIEKDKEKFMDLLLIGDEQADMVLRYLSKSDLFALYDGTLRTVCAVTNEGGGIFEIKNLATYEDSRKKGYGSKMIKHVLEYYRNKGNSIILGTGAGTSLVKFYENFGFGISHTVKDFFKDNYDHPIIEEGIILCDMVYLKKEL